MKVEATKTLSWSEIELAPMSSGIYAWYSHLSLSKADISAVISRIELAKQDSVQRARQEVEVALDKFIFNPFKESPYEVILRGQLKPRFGGEISHEPMKSDSLVNRLAENPERFRIIADVLKIASPSFTAPLYIGMAVNLRKRLRWHRNKIDELRNQKNIFDVGDTAEAGFANQVVARNFDPTNLFVHIAEVDVDTSEHNDLENILNRINYPIFGRN